MIGSFVHRYYINGCVSIGCDFIFFSRSGHVDAANLFFREPKHVDAVLLISYKKYFL